MSTRDTDTYEIGTDETGSLCVIFAKWSREMEQHQTSLERVSQRCGESMNHSLI